MHQHRSMSELRSSQGGTVQPDDLIETVECPSCAGKQYHILQPAAYPANLSRAELLKIYSPSSDHILFQAIVQCDSCSLVYLNPRIRHDLIIASYSEAADPTFIAQNRSEEHTSELQSLAYLVCRLLLEQIH